MYYLIEGYKRHGKTLGEKPLKAQAVTIQQLTGAIERLLVTGSDVVLVERLSEEAFRFFYQEKRSKTKQ